MHIPATMKPDRVSRSTFQAKLPTIHVTVHLDVAILVREVQSNKQAHPGNTAGNRKQMR